MRTYFEQMFPVWTNPKEYTFTDYPRITTPMLMLCGDRDDTCRLPEAHALFQQLPQGEYGAVPGTAHHFSRVGCLIVLAYLLRHVPERG